MTIGFQGHHSDKMRISYKREGDGFQCDALCDNGFTYSVFFRNERPPAQHTRLGFSALHARSLWLLDQLKDRFHKVHVDNLYMSAKFAKGAWNLPTKVMVGGVTRTNDRGLPNHVLQEPVKKEQHLSVHGTIKAAVLEGDKDCPQLVALSIYDVKPVHFLTMHAESICWIQKKRPVWNPVKRCLDDITFLRCNVNNDYNFKMNAVDIADQLRNNYRMDHWLRNRKWWWSIYLWGMGVLLTNAYLVYRKLQDDAGVPNSRRLSHYDFLLEVGTAWVSANEEDIRQVRRRNRCKRKSSDAERSDSGSDNEDDRPQHTNDPSPCKKPKATSTFVTPSKPTVAPRVNDKGLHPQTGALRVRINHFNTFHCPQPIMNTETCCQLHRWALGRKNGCHGQMREKLLNCSICGVNLCIDCFKTFHTVEDLVAVKEDMKKQFLKAAGK